MSVGQKFGKFLPPDGQQIVWNNVVLTSGGLTGTVFPASGVSGATPATAGQYFDVYGVALSSNDTASQQVTLSDGVNSVTWSVTSPNAICDDALTPYRFNANVPLVVSAGSVTAAKQINVAIRGVVTKTS